MNLTSTVPEMAPAEKRALLSRLMAKKHGSVRSAPVSFGQERLWFISQLDPESLTYNIPFRLQVEGLLDVRALGEAFQALADRHEILRTTFANVAGKLLQMVASGVQVRMPVTDLSTLVPDERQAEGLRLAREAARRTFDLRRWPLWRVGLLRLEPERHLLLLTVHHIVFDGWSFQILVRELSELYGAQVEGRPHALPPLRIQYADYARWQRQQLDEPRVEKQLSFWRRQLADPVDLELPTDFARPPVQTFNGGSVYEMVPPTEAAALKELARRQGVTLFMLLAAVVEVLLYRYTGQRDLTFGTVVANRSRPEVEDLIGFFVNTLTLRARMGPSLRFRQLLDLVRQTTLAAFENQDVPFEKLVEDLRPQRDLSRHPFFQVMVVLMNVSASDLELPGLRLRPLELAGSTVKFDLTIEFTEETAGLRVALQYNSDLFREATVRRMLGHLLKVLAAVQADIEIPIETLPLLSAAERSELDGWNDTALRPSPFEPVYQAVLAQATARPGAMAVEGATTGYTYGQLAERARRLASHLQRLGVASEVPVAICADRSPQAVVGMLAVLIAGGAYLPLDPEHPPERLAELVLAAGAKVVLIWGREPGWSGLGVPWLDLDDPELFARDPLTTPVPSHPHHLAYVLYTSGSSGKPKAVMISQAALAHLVRWHGQRYGVGPEDRCSLLASPAFDAVVQEAWPHLAAGACLQVAPRETVVQPAELVRWLAERAITLAFLPTPLAEATMAVAWPETVSLRLLLTGGDRLHGSSCRPLPCELINEYGPTEATVCATIQPVTPEAGGGDPPIGRPVANTRVHLVDARLQRIPAGVSGEIALAGDGLARGYLGQPRQTAERFVPDPWSLETGDRLYLTGDRARHRPDGALEFQGRLDHQIKVRGFRIEPGEIESALQEHPAVRHTAVVARPQETGGLGLVAYIVSEPEAPPFVELVPQLRSFLRQRLPEYMVPAILVPLPELPLTGNGKVARAALPEPERGHLPEPSEDALPRSELEVKLAEIWKQVLRLDRVGVHDNFFDLGGHSLLLAEVHSRLQADGSLRPIEMVELFRHTTIAALAQTLSGGGNDSAVRLDKVHQRAAMQRQVLGAIRRPAGRSSGRTRDV